MDPLQVLKATPYLPLSTFLPPPPFLLHSLHTSKTYFGQSDESQLPWGSDRSGGCTPGTASPAPLAMPPNLHKPRKWGLGGQKEDNVVLNEPGPQCCDYP